MKKISELISLSGRVALVCGGAGYIGKAICEALAENGSALAILDLPMEKCQKVADSICEKYRVETLALAVDLANEDEVRKVAGKVEAHFGRIDVLINCAAFVGTSGLEGWTVPFLEQSSDTWRKALEVNMTSAFMLIQDCTPYLQKSGKGSIVNIGSIYGVVGPDMRLYEGTSMGNPAAYAASKGGMLQLTKWLATVVAPNIRVNMISPGGVWRDQPDSFQQRYISRTPLGRMATEEDIIGAALYFASDMSSYVTGQNLLVDGGWTAW